jgi:hypothetical protein
MTAPLMDILFNGVGWTDSGGPEPSGRGRIPNAAVWGVRTTINF